LLLKAIFNNITHLFNGCIFWHGAFAQAAKHAVGAPRKIDG
jgi:hypothetical protein